MDLICPLLNLTDDPMPSNLLITSLHAFVEGRKRILFGVRELSVRVLGVCG